MALIFEAARADMQRVATRACPFFSPTVLVQLDAIQSARLGRVRRRQIRAEMRWILAIVQRKGAHSEHLGGLWIGKAAQLSTVASSACAKTVRSIEPLPTIPNPALARCLTKHALKRCSHGERTQTSKSNAPPAQPTAAGLS